MVGRKSRTMIRHKQAVVSVEDLGLIPYKLAWDYQEQLMQQNLQAKQVAIHADHTNPAIPDTTHHFLLCEHPPVYTLGRNGNRSNILISEQELHKQQIDFYHINRGGDITFHGPGQIVGYPILDLEKFYTDISRYIFEIEEVIIRTLADFNITGERSKGETGVWIEPQTAGRARKICAIGIRCSRWITMHGFALNVNTDLDYFNHIIPCGIAHKKVTSMQKELSATIDIEMVKNKILHHLQDVFNISLSPVKPVLLLS
jgi:lipoyl(octanoyl) transferase